MLLCVQERPLQLTLREPSPPPRRCYLPSEARLLVCGLAQGGQAAKHGGLRVGMELVAVNGSSCLDKARDEIEDEIKQSGRPVRLTFRQRSARNSASRGGRRRRQQETTGGRRSPRTPPRSRRYGAVAGRTGLSPPPLPAALPPPEPEPEPEPGAGLGLGPEPSPEPEPELELEPEHARKTGAQPEPEPEPEREQPRQSVLWSGWLHLPDGQRRWFHCFVPNDGGEEANASGCYVAHTAEPPRSYQAGDCVDAAPATTEAGWSDLSRLVEVTPSPARPEQVRT